MYKKPLFVSGIGRSGTSAVISSLAKHKSVVEPHRIGEAPIVGHFINFLIDYEDKSPNREYHLKNYQLDVRKRDEAYSNLLSSLQYGFDVNETSQSEELWIAKVSLSQVAYRKACEMFQDLRVVYVLRNGIEVVNSARSFGGFAHLTFKEICQRWSGNIELCRYVHSTPMCSVVKHHELVNDPVNVYETVYRELKMENDLAPAQFIKTTLFNSSFDKTSNVKSIASVFDNRLACWDEWTSAEKDTFLENCDELMMEFEFHRPYASSDVREA